jgi:hypothetical protein
MSESEATTGAAAEGAAAEGAAAAPAKPKPPAKPPRDLPTSEQLADWYAGADCPSIDNLFNNLVLMKFDALVMQIRKEELVPQHWQILKDREVDEGTFDQLPEVGRLRVRYKNQELARRRTEALRVAWRELRGKRPNLWTVPDVLAAMRRILEKKERVDFHELLSAVRDVWDGMSIPFGQEQKEILWAVLDFVGSKTKK